MVESRAQLHSKLLKRGEPIYCLFSRYRCSYSSNLWETRNGGLLQVTEYLAPPPDRLVTVVFFISSMLPSWQLMDGAQQRDWLPMFTKFGSTYLGVIKDRRLERCITREITFKHGKERCLILLAGVQRNKSKSSGDCS